MTSNLSRFTRRRLLAGTGTGAVGLASLLAVGCGGDDDGEEAPGEGASSPAAAGTSPTAANAPKKGGTLRINQTADLVLNAGYPFVVAPQNGRLPWMVSEALIRYRKDVQKPELVLADKFEYNADRTKLTVAIKQGAVFHNGAPVTPEDVFFGIDFNLDPKQFG